jgi:zinc protease
MRIIEPLPSDIMPFRAWEETLANGLRVIVVPTGYPHLVSLQIPVQTGSRNEVEPGKSGFAHFFEHMMFRGTERLSADAYQAIVTRTGARQNAYTTDDYTNYHITFAREDLETILDIEADRFMNLRYSEADFRTEARAVLGEYNKSSSDPLTKLIEVQRDHAYTVHTYKHTTMGFIADIEAMPEQFDYSRTFFERWYRPEYATIILAGDVEPEATLALVQRYWGAWRAGNAAPVSVPQEPAPSGPVAATLSWPAPTLPWVTVGVHGPAFSAHAPGYAALDLLFDLSFGETSDIYRELVERDQLVDQLFPFGGGTQDPGLFTVLARVKDPADMVRVRARILDALAEARDRRIDARRLADAKANARYGFARALDNSESIAATLARFVRYERRYETLNDLFRTYDAVTVADVSSVAHRYIVDSGTVYATVASGEVPTELARPGRLPAVEPANRIFPVIEQQSASTLLRFKLLFGVGSAHDPAGKEGLAALAASMIAEAGSTRMRIDEITEALFPMAGAFRAQVDREMTTFTGVIHADNVDRFMDVVLPQLRSPGFREDDFARLRARQLNALTIDLRSNNDEELGKERLQENAFGASGYGHPAPGTVAGVESLTMDDVRGFIASRYVQANLSVGLAGAFPDPSRERLLDELARLPAGEPAHEPAIWLKRTDGIDIEIIEKETRAVAISLGHPIEVTRAHTDYAALWLARSWFGEHRASHGQLFQRLREVRGLNYGDYAYIEAFPRGMYQFFPDPNLGRRAQLFEVWIRPVAPEHGVFALKAALWELRRLIAQGLTAEAFESTREYLLKNLYVMTKTQDQQLGYALDSRWYGMGDYIEHMQTQLRSLTCEAVNAAVGHHLSGTDLHVVMIAKEAAGLRDQLLSGAYTGIVYGSEKDESVRKEDREIGALQLGLSPDRIRVTPVDDVFAR